jgi:hypothetical protein
MDKHDIAKKIGQTFNAKVRKWVSINQFELDSGVTYTISPSDQGWSLTGIKADGSRDRTVTVDPQGIVKV